MSRSTKISKRRYLVVSGIVALAFPLVIYQIIRLTVQNKDAFLEYARRQHNLFVEIPPERGAILDRNLRELAGNLNTPSVSAIPRLIEQREREPLAERLSMVLHLSKPFVLERLSKNKGFVWLKRHVSQEQMRHIQELKHPCVRIELEPKRFYPNGKMLSNVLGFCNIDNAGVDGLELFYEDKLKGEPGFRLTKRDGLQREVVALEKKVVQPVNGTQAVLTIDHYLQYLTDQALDDAFEKWKAKSAVAVVMNPHTGEILALSSRPTFDPNQAGEAIPESRRNRVITDIFEPGSVFKVVTAAGALNEGAVTVDDRFDCERGRWQARPGRVIHDVHPYGMLSFPEVLIHSSNIGTVKIAKRLGEAKLYDYVKRFGFGERTGIDFPGEVSGILRPPARWSKYSITSIPFGQEVAATAIQMIRAISVIANGGHLVRPYLLKEMRDERGVTLFRREPVIRPSVIKPETAETMRSILERVIEEGTGARAKIEGVRAAGKTGTSQKLNPGGGYSHNHFVGSFIGFAPAEAPMLAMFVSIDDPNPFYYGGTVAAPVFKEVIGPALRYLGYVPEEEKKRAKRVLIYPGSEERVVSRAAARNGASRVPKNPRQEVQGAAP